MFKATALIKQEMDKRNLKYMVNESNERSAIIAGFSVKNGPNLRVEFISIKDNNAVAIRLFGLITKVAPEDRTKIYEVINTIHIQYRYARFYLDENGDVDVSFDLPMETPDEGVGPECVEILARFVEIVNKVYPNLMRALWA